MRHSIQLLGATKEEAMRKLMNSNWALFVLVVVLFVAVFYWPGVEGIGRFGEEVGRAIRSSLARFS